MLTLSKPLTSTALVRQVDPSVRSLAAGDVLFREGDPRGDVYRIEKGAVCLFTEGDDGVRHIIEFAFPGDLLGLGYLKHHAFGAQATLETSLTCLPRAALEEALEETEEGAARLSAAMEREIACLKEALRRKTAGKPLSRIAALLVTLGHGNACEGRDPTVITDSLTCGVVAGYLEMSVDDLAQGLGALKARDLVESCDGGLRLKDLAALERLASAE